MIIQRSDEWFEKRRGKVTASRVADVLATIKSGEAAVRANYKAQLVAERLTGCVQKGYVNDAMRWGTEQEPFARMAYEIYTDSFVTEIDFIDHPTILMSGASPDGLIDSDGMLEIKCPETKKHIHILLTEEIPSEWIPQMVWQMACSGRKWVDFMSYDSRLPESMQSFVKRLYRDEDVISQYEESVKKFNDEVSLMVLKLQNRSSANDAVNELNKEVA